MEIYKCSDLSFGYKKNKNILNKISLTIKQGDVLGLLGPNGAGKSTFTRIMLGIENLKKGEQKWFGSHKIPVRKIGYVPQEIAVMDDLSTLENVEFFGRLYGLKGEKLKYQVKKTLQFVDLWEERKIRPTKFSGGMLRRLNIACGIVHNPEVIIFDEPTVGVDPQSRNHILETIEKLNSKGTTIIYISHYMEEVEKICKKVAIIDNGHIIAEGETTKVIEKYTGEKRITFKAHNLEEKDFEFLKENFNKCKSNGDYIEILLQDSSPILNIILSYFGSRIYELEVKTPNLEDVFFNLTKKKLRD
jgi:ABC-2 type transport system ATP-binding protein